MRQSKDPPPAWPPSSCFLLDELLVRGYWLLNGGTMLHATPSTLCSLFSLPSAQPHRFIRSPDRLRRQRDVDRGCKYKKLGSDRARVKLAWRATGLRPRGTWTKIRSSLSGSLGY